MHPRPPHRWDLLSPDQLGTLVDPGAPRRTPCLEELVEAAARVVARGGGGRLVFVGRSLDSVHDLLGGILEDCAPAPDLVRLPVSMTSPATTTEHVRWLRATMTDLGLSPHDLARGSTPVAFVDVAHVGRTFGSLYAVVRRWVDDDEPGAWPVVRRRLRFVGITSRCPTSPRTWRWHQHAPWTRDLPAGAVRNIALDPAAWSYLGNHQVKLTRSHPRRRWLDEPDGPRHDEVVRAALAEALAYVAAGRSRDVRRRFVAVLQGEPAISESWLRTLAGAAR